MHWIIIIILTASVEVSVDITTDYKFDTEIECQNYIIENYDELNQDINEKYIQSGITIELGIMYIPSESLMQLIDSIGNIREEIFRDNRVLIMGPNSLAAYLISVHMGFRTLAMNERASEIMKEFGKLKKEFENFGNSTEDLQKKTDALLKAVNEHATRERQMSKAIKSMDQVES